MKLSEITDDTDKIVYLCDWILCNGASVGKIKREILAHIATMDPKYNIALDCCRLRKKNGRSPTKIFYDDQKFGEDIILLSNCEV